MSEHQEENRRTGKNRRETDQWFRLLIENMNEGLAVQDKKGFFIYVNPALCKMLGYLSEEVLGKHYSDFFDEANQIVIEKELLRRKEGRVHPYEITWTAKDKQVITNISPQPLFDKTGYFKGCFAIIVDITERKRTVERLRLLFNAIEQSPTAALVVEINGNIEYVNPMFTQLTGYSAEELAGKNLSILQSGETSFYGYQRLWDTMMAGCWWQGEIQNKKKNGEHYWAFESISPVENEQGIITHYITLQEDITYRKQSEKTLKKSERELRALSARLLTVQEQERKRVASELHDGIGQYLSAIKFSLDSINELLGETLTKAAPQVWMNTNSMIQEAIEEARRISMDLRPAVLDDVGLLAAISWFCRKFQTIYPAIRIETHIDIQENEIPCSLKIVLYRVLQEALNNIAKHAKADLAHLYLKKSGDTIKLAIEDNGYGFKIAEVLSREACIKGFGLVSMRERIELSCGLFSLESTPDTGTKIRASWPLSEIGKSTSLPKDKPFLYGIRG